MPQHRDDKPKSQVDAIQNRGRGRDRQTGTVDISGRQYATFDGDTSGQSRGPAPRQSNAPTAAPTGRRAGLREDSQAVRQGLVGIGTDDTASQDRAAEAVAGLRRSPGGFLAQPTEEGVTQFQRRQHLDAARDRHALEREAFGAARGAGRAETAVRSSLRGRDRMDEVLRQNAMTGEEREREAGLISDAAQQDAAALREARGLRQSQDLGEQELAGRERDSQRRFQASLADTQARLAGQQGERDQRNEQQAFNITLETARGTLPPEMAERPGLEGQLRTFMSETNKDQINETVPMDLRDEDVGALFGIAAQFGNLGTRRLATLGLTRHTPGQPVSAQPIVELIKRAAMNPGESKIQMGRGEIAVSELEDFAGGIFNQFVERARAGFENQVTESVLRGEDLNKEQQQFVQGQLNQEKQSLKEGLGLEQATEPRGLADTPERGPGTQFFQQRDQTQTVSSENIPELQAMGVDAEEGDSIEDVRKKIDNLSVDDFAPVLARRAMAQRDR